MDAEAELGRRVGDVIRFEALRDDLPVLAAVVGAEGAGRGNGNEDAIGIARIEEDGVQSHATGAGGPLGALYVAQRVQFLPGLAAVR